ncbi:hypothetical protein ACNTMW_03425 [Planosporangium sp. 12N6]|uniref:hypothetical protein n=1 Tax=Planosporangium spinosum TaxID=3402278 RepID=UPI003CF6A6FC
MRLVWKPFRTVSGLIAKSTRAGDPGHLAAVRLFVTETLALFRPIAREVTTGRVAHRDTRLTPSPAVR